MRILVLADSHTDIDTMHDVIGRVKPDSVIHLGDHIVDAVLLRSRHPELHFDMVRGNCDRNENHCSDDVIRIGSITAFITHGDAYQVDDGIDRVLKAGQDAKAQLVLHGQTHIPNISMIQGVVIMNPGRIGRVSSKRINASFGVIETLGDDFCCSIFFVDSFETSAYVSGRFNKDYILG